MASTNCETCRQTYQQYNDDGYDDVEPPCGTCFPGIEPFNEIVVEIFNLSNGQYVSDNNYILNGNFLLQIIDKLGVAPEDELEVYNAVQLLNNEYVKTIRAKADNGKSKNRN